MNRQTEKKLKYFKSDDHVLIYRLSEKQENMFDGTFGKYTGTA